VDRYPRRLFGAAATCAAAALIVYTAQLQSMPPRIADAVLQPAMLLSCLAAVTVLYLIGSRWAAGPKKHQRTIELLSDASFGVYLAHPLVLVLLLDFAGFAYWHQTIPAVVATVVGYVLTVVGSIGLAVAARHTRLSLALAGRPRGTPARRLMLPLPRRKVVLC
jgi:peptidoglycan/LPS O-acetylase OafA/YrhL